jgi:AbrB family looped-hinge helix DNA binding protein
MDLVAWLGQPGRSACHPGKYGQYSVLLFSYFGVVFTVMKPEIIKLSSKGQIVIPKAIRAAHQWEVGQKLELIDTGDGILLRAEKPFPQTSIEAVAGILKYTGKPKSLQDMEAAIKKGAKESR